MISITDKKKKLLQNDIPCSKRLSNSTHVGLLHVSIKKRGKVGFCKRLETRVYVYNYESTSEKMLKDTLDIVRVISRGTSSRKQPALSPREESHKAGRVCNPCRAAFIINGKQSRMKD